MEMKRMITVVGVHTAGERNDVITGGVLDVWFLGKDDDTNHQKYLANADQAREPDAYINFLATAHASGDVVGAKGLVRLPAHPFKVLGRPTPGVSLPASGNILKLGCVAVEI